MSYFKLLLFLSSAFIFTNCGKSRIILVPTKPKVINVDVVVLEERFKKRKLNLSNLNLSEKEARRARLLLRRLKDKLKNQGEGVDRILDELDQAFKQAEEQRISTDEFFQMVEGLNRAFYPSPETENTGDKKDEYYRALIQQERTQTRETVIEERDLN